MQFFWNSVPQCGDAKEDEEDSKEHGRKQYMERYRPNTLAPVQSSSTDFFLNRTENQDMKNTKKPHFDTLVRMSDCMLDQMLYGMSHWMSDKI